MNVEVLEAMIRGQPNEFLVKSITYQSPTLRELSRKFKSKFAVGKPKIIYFYEMEPSFTPKQVFGPLFNLYIEGIANNLIA